MLEILLLFFRKNKVCNMPIVNNRENEQETEKKKEINTGVTK